MPHDVTIGRVLQELAAIALFDPRRILDANGQALDLKDLPADVAAAVRSLSISYSESRSEDGVFDRVRTVELRPCEKLKALHLLLGYLERQQGKDLPEELTPEEAASLLSIEAARKRA